MSSEIIIQTHRLCRAYDRDGQFWAVENADLQIPSGSFVCIKGPSGSGKSTLLSMLAGLLRPTCGTVLFRGSDMSAMSDRELSRLRREQIGYMPQGYALLGSLTVRENTALPLHMSRTYGQDSEYLDSLLKRMRIEHLADSLPSSLSGGERRRAVIARALAPKPAVILADEPANDLDEENRAEVLRIFREIADEGTAIVMVTHENESEQYADTIYNMRGGKIA